MTTPSLEITAANKSIGRVDHVSKIKLTYITNILEIIIIRGSRGAAVPYSQVLSLSLSVRNWPSERVRWGGGGIRVFFTLTLSQRHGTVRWNGMGWDGMVS